MLKRLFKFLIYSVLVVIFVQYGCDTKSSSEGDFDQIFVFSDSSLYLEFEDELDKVFDQYVHTPHAEKSFYHKWSPIDLMDIYKKRRNVILVGLLNRNDPISEYVKKILSPDLISKIQNGEIFETQLFQAAHQAVLCTTDYKKQNRK